MSTLTSQILNRRPGLRTFHKILCDLAPTDTKTIGRIMKALNYRGVSEEEEVRRMKPTDLTLNRGIGKNSVVLFARAHKALKGGKAVGERPIDSQLVQLFRKQLGFTKAQLTDPNRQSEIEYEVRSLTRRLMQMARAND